MDKRILVIGSIFTDFVMHVDKVPLANEVTREYGSRETIAGGAGLNVAAAFSRLEVSPGTYKGHVYRNSNFKLFIESNDQEAQET